MKWLFRGRRKKEPEQFGNASCDECGYRVLAQFDPREGMMRFYTLDAGTIKEVEVCPQCNTELMYANIDG